jgi:SpoVK/Ycf46/Vps4 family AAA+-type ATPase
VTNQKLGATSFELNQAKDKSKWYENEIARIQEAFDEVTRGAPSPLQHSNSEIEQLKQLRIENQALKKEVKELRTQRDAERAMRPC